jgi:hypothetical protein
VKRLASFAIFGALSITACGTSTEPASIAGAYILQTINGSTLPYTYAEGVDFKLETISETLVFSANGGLTLNRTVRTTDGANVTTEPDAPKVGQYSRSGNSVTLTLQGASVTATLNSGSLAIADHGDNYLFTRSPE